MKNTYPMTYKMKVQITDPNTPKGMIQNSMVMVFF